MHPLYVYVYLYTSFPDLLVEKAGGFYMPLKELSATTLGWFCKDTKSEDSDYLGFPALHVTPFTYSLRVYTLY